MTGGRIGSDLHFILARRTGGPVLDAILAGGRRGFPCRGLWLVEDEILGAGAGLERGVEFMKDGACPARRGRLGRIGCGSSATGERRVRSSTNEPRNGGFEIGPGAPGRDVGDATGLGDDIVLVLVPLLTEGSVRHLTRHSW